jgi:hypothetical protein
MPPQKKNPLGLNPLQLKTLTLFQALAEIPEHGQPGAVPGTMRVGNLPRPHGDHFHVGHTLVASRDASPPPPPPPGSATRPCGRLWSARG